MSVQPASDLVPLAERTGVLHSLRLAMVIAVLGAAAVVPDTLGAPVGRLALVTAVYASLVVAAECVHRASQMRRLTLVGTTLLADGVWIAAVVTRTGGPRSLLMFLVILHVVAVTLLASYRTGLKIAVWHSLLLIVVSAGVVPEWEPPDRDVDDGVLVLWVVAFLAAAVGTAAFSSLNERELRRSRREVRELAAMGSELQEVRTPEQVVRVLLDRIIKTFGFARCALVVGDMDGIREISVASGTESQAADLICVDSRHRGPDEVLQQAWRERKFQLVRRLGADSPALSDALPGARNLVVVPMAAEGRPVGAVVAERGGTLGALISLSQVNALEEFAAHGSLALRSAWLLAEVERLARVDDLTGLPNRRTLEDTLEREVARAERSREPLSVVMLDIDHFKRLNDTYGHPLGDEVLRLIGQVLANSVRQVDLPARYGGEEFVLVLPDCPAREAARIAEQVRRTIETRSDGLAVTASAGVATMPANARTPAELVQAADEAMYQAKRAGRDRVSISARQPSVVSPSVVA